MKTLLMFGTFDGLHEGHLQALRETWNHGEKIIVALAQDAVVERLKGKVPKYVFQERAEALENSGLVDEVLAGDGEDGVYHVLEKAKPDVIAFGYDQKALQENLLAFLKKKGKSIPSVTLAPHEPERYKSSLLNE